MSRVGKMPIPIPSGVAVEAKGLVVTVKGPKGELSQTIRPEVSVDVTDGQVIVTRKNDAKKSRGFHGLYRNLINNMVIGVSEGYTRNLQINGVGYRAELDGKLLLLNLGFSSQIEFVVPDGITIETDGPNKVTVKGISKELVGKTASEIRSLRPPEPYKGKGIKYDYETIRRKVGKSGIK
jgi:large subunit ribosomal protein L6